MPVYLNECETGKAVYCAPPSFVGLRMGVGPEETFRLYVVGEDGHSLIIRDLGNLTRRGHLGRSTEINAAHIIAIMPDGLYDVTAAGTSF